MHRRFLLFDNLTTQVARDIRDVEPAVVVLGDELGKLDLARLLHLLDEVEQPSVVGPVAGDEVGGTAQEVMAVLGTAHEGVELLAAVAAAHDDGLAPRCADGVEELVYKHVQQVIGTLGRAVVDTLTLRRGTGGEFFQTKIFHIFLNDDDNDNDNFF